MTDPTVVPPMNRITERVTIFLLLPYSAHKRNTKTTRNLDHAEDEKSLSHLNEDRTIYHYNGKQCFDTLPSKPRTACVEKMSNLETGK